MKLNKIGILLGIVAVASISPYEVRSQEKIAKESTLEPIAQRGNIRQEIPPLIVILKLFVKVVSKLSIA